MTVKIFPSGPIATNAIVIASGGEALVVDPAEGSLEWIEKQVQGLEVVGIVLTHSHWDHIADCAAVKERFGAPVWVHAEDRENLARPGADGLPMLMPIQGVEADGLLEDGQKIVVGELELEVMHTPGHAPGHCCLYCANENFLVSGDHVFRGSIGNLSLPTGQPERMWPSLERIAQLPPDTVVYPGHGEPTTLGAETWLSRAKEIFGG